MASQWIETASGNRILRRAVVLGAPTILLAGSTTIGPGACLRGDVRLVGANSISLQIGKHSLVGAHTEVCPPIIGFKRMKSKDTGSGSGAGGSCPLGDCLVPCLHVHA